MKTAILNMAEPEIKLEQKAVTSLAVPENKRIFPDKRHGKWCYGTGIGGESCHRQNR